MTDSMICYEASVTETLSGKNIVHSVVLSLQLSDS